MTMSRGDDRRSTRTVARETVVIRLVLGALGPVVQLHDAVGHIRGQHLPKAVDAAVVVEEELLHSDEAMELDPLLQVAGLVPEDGASRKVVHLERF